jgi:hypothetical protein
MAIGRTTARIEKRSSPARVPGAKTGHDGLVLMGRLTRAVRFSKTLRMLRAMALEDYFSVTAVRKQPQMAVEQNSKNLRVMLLFLDFY